MFAILNLNHEMPFGKYKDETLADVIGKDPRYVLWCLDNIEGFHIHPDVREVLMDSYEAHAFSGYYPTAPGYHDEVDYDYDDPFIWEPIT